MARKNIPFESHAFRQAYQEPSVTIDACVRLRRRLLRKETLTRDIVLLY